MVIVEDRTARTFGTQDPAGHVHYVTITGDIDGAYCTCGVRLCEHVDEARRLIRAEIDASMQWSPILQAHPIEVLEVLPS